MRIFYASPDSPNPDFPSRLWRANLYDALVGLGHDVAAFDFDFAQTFRHLDPNDPSQQSFILENRPRVTRELLRQVEAAHHARPIDLFFSYFYDACVEPGAIEQIKALGTTTINWYCNASFQLLLVREIAPHYDFCLVPEKARLSDYRALGAKPIYCQEAANPAVYHPCDVPLEFDVTFVGQCYADRADHVLWLLANGVDVRVWGPMWEYHVQPRTRNPLTRWFRTPTGLPPGAAGGVLSDDGLVEMYSRSKINLGFSTCGETHRTDDRMVQIRLRDFEVPMSGGFYLVEHSEELAEFFEFGSEIETYRSREEMLDKIRFYLSHDAARERIRWAGRTRCLRDHTWQKRFESVFKELGLS
jgi:hypothetical protein